MTQNTHPHLFACTSDELLRLFFSLFSKFPFPKKEKEKIFLIFI